MKYIWIPSIDRYNRMTFLGYFIWFCISSCDMTMGSSNMLPHVLKYKTLIPQQLQHVTQITSAQQTYPGKIGYSLTIEGHNYTLHLEKNRNLLRRNYTVTHYTEHGTEVISTQDHEDHCYYHGHIVEVEDSSASMQLCSGLKGFVRIRDRVYLIEPLAPGGGKEAPHAVYKYEHLRRKRSTCSHGNTTTFYDHVSRPSGLFQPGSLASEAQMTYQNKRTRTVEMVLVVDKDEYTTFGSEKAVETRMLEVANHVDKLYRPVGIRVMLVGLEIWTYNQIEVSREPKITLDRFLEWRQQSLLRKIKHDNAQFVTGVDFVGSTVGLAKTDSMCTSKSGAVNEDHDKNPVGLAATIAHEMGHNLGLSHDSDSCNCGSSTSNKGCIMSERFGLVFPEKFSSCSQQQLNGFLEEFNPSCLLDTPSTNRIFGGPVCGNAFLEPGEECDCGTVKECKNPCCNASTCTLNTGAQCADGECCYNCQLKPTGSVCRARSGDCDLEEYCSGFSAVCPEDTYTQNGRSCNRGTGYCYNGQCPSHKQHCRRLWGPDAEVGATVCYKETTCKRSVFGQRCSEKEQMCGTLFCSGGREFPVTSRKSFHTVNGVTCNEATMDPKDNFPADLGMVPTGAKCGNNMVCYEHRCQDMKNIKAYGTDDCSTKCNNHGVCNHERQCHCDPGWAPPFCDVEHSEMPKGSEMPLVIGVSLAAGLLLLIVLIIGSLMCCKRKRQPQKRFQSTSGQANPVFQSGIVRDSPRIQPAFISQPVFVNTSATQACKPLHSATPTTTGAIIVPTRTAPAPPVKILAVAHPSRVEQAVKPSLPPSALRKEAFEVRPLPPSRPLPPLATKPTLSQIPKPPLPPTKPSIVRPPWKQPQVPTGKTAHEHAQMTISKQSQL